MLLELRDLKNLLHTDLERADKVLVALAYFENPVAVADVRCVAIEAGFKFPNSWNLSQILMRTKGLAIRVPDGWELSDAGRAHLSNLGITKASPATVKIAADLRAHLGRISDEATASFAEEAIRCLEAELYRSAIVMSWLASIDTLYKLVVRSHLDDFNAECKKIDPKWKSAKTADDLGSGLISRARR